MNVPVVEVERELGGDLDREVDIDTAGNAMYLIADEVSASTS